ncbi:MAG: carbohydrate kinase family protein [Ignavibacteriae bacterium]|nr:carbohydrate kinase family protein [Ignavibacteria bacterium]MBI3364136.1 carbohydrate kinase family protein [Ignavibacteriota bacterium]
MRITVIGHLCLDVIHHADGSETQSPGGIFFSVAALANLLPLTDTVQPVFGVGKNEYDSIIEQLQSYKNVDTSGIYRFPGPTNHVELMYRDSKERVECSKHIAEPIHFKKIKPYLETDMVLVNMISGFDITLDTLDHIRMEIRDAHTPIYMDVHSLTLGVNDDFTRFHRPLEAWRRWLFMIHGAQMNEEEAAILTTEKFGEEGLAKQILALNTKVFIITRSERGCTGFADTRKHIQRYEIAGIPAGDHVDPTGCGDVFAAAYCAHYVKTKDIASSLAFANQVAARKAQLVGSTDIDVLSSFRLEEIHQEQQP